MKILIIRHGDPDYAIDSLTEKGHREAKLLAERVAPMKIAAYYVSPLGRAKATAEYTLKNADAQQKLLTGCTNLTAILLSVLTVRGVSHGICCRKTGLVFPNIMTKTSGLTFP